MDGCAREPAKLRFALSPQSSLSPFPVSNCLFALQGWKRRWFVLRADRLSCYKDQKEYKIHRQIFLADVTAVAPLRDPKQPYSFGVFSQSKNFHFKADTEPDTADWTEKIWAAVAKEVPVEGMMLSSPVTPALAGALSPPPPPPPPPPSLLPIGASAGAGSGAGAGIPAGCRRASAQTLDYSGPDVGSVSSLSDVAGISQLSLSHQDAAQAQAAQAAQAAAEAADLPRPIARNGSGFSSTEHLPRVVWHGYMYCLKSKGAVKQWKKYWIVVRNINIAFYKNKEVPPHHPPSGNRTLSDSFCRNTVPSKSFLSTV